MANKAMELQYSCLKQIKKNDPESVDAFLHDDSMSGSNILQQHYALILYDEAIHNLNSSLRNFFYWAN